MDGRCGKPGAKLIPVDVDMSLGLIRPDLVELH